MDARWIFLSVSIAGCTSNVTPNETGSGKLLFLGGEAIVAPVRPPPMSGGTLFASRVHPELAFASNPDADVVDVVDMNKEEVVWSVHLERGAEPGRIAEDGAGRAYVALRNAGAVAILDPIARTTTIRPVCPSPRGLAFDGTAMWVACASSELVRLSANRVPEAIFSIERDLRDVMIGPDGAVWVSTFRSSQLLRIAPDGTVAERRSIAPSGGNGALLLPHLSWRATVAPDGSIVQLHQMHTTTPLGSALVNHTEAPAYYGENDSSIVVPAVTQTKGAASTTTTLSTLDGVIDLAVSDDGRLGIASQGSVGVYDARLNGITSMAIWYSRPVAVAFRHDTGAVLVQTREPSELWIQGGHITPLSPTQHDSAFSIFHDYTNNHIACMSCHAEGGDDGHTWQFADVGPRRTQSLRGGLLATAPFHWDGAMNDLSKLAHVVFTDRMGGDDLSEAQIAILGSWLDRIPPLPAPSTLDASAVARGRALFAGSGCDTCHSGAAMTNNLNENVGTGAGKILTFQVPSLIGVGARAPFMHTGCAPTLADRFTERDCGGGTAHGNTAGFGGQNIADLTTYLESL
jgi:hypothetical protein